MNKQQIITAWLNRGEVFVELDARQPGVSVPAGLASRRALRLKFSFRYSPPDLRVDDWGMQATLGFGAHSFKVRVPWAAIFYASSAVAQQSRAWEHPAEPPASPATVREARGHLLN